MCFCLSIHLNIDSDDRKITFKENAMRVHDLGEMPLLARLLQQESLSRSDRILGPGDDCAVLSMELFRDKNAKHLLVTTDTMVEGRHFTLETIAPYELGWKLLAVNLSDIAAMGGVPVGVVLTLQLRSSLEVSFLEEVYRGIRDLGKNWNVEILGGDTVSATELAFGASVIGFSTKSPMTRSGAQEGDDLWVSGSVGGSGAGYRMLTGNFQHQLLAAHRNLLRKAHQQPQPRVALGKLLIEHGMASACIDLSDGLLQDALHLAERSGVQIVIDPQEVPLPPCLREMSYPVAEALRSGEDYELLFTASAKFRDQLAQLKLSESGETLVVTRIGRVFQENTERERVFIGTAEREIFPATDWLLKETGTTRLGFQHFS